MLTNELMGGALLALSWVTALLVMADMLVDVRAVRGRLAEWRNGLVEGTVEADELAVHEIEQRVRVFDAPVPTLGFFDRSHTSRLLGGKVRLASDVLEVVPTPDAEVWTSAASKAAAAACANPAAFDDLAARAKGSTGALRTVSTPISRGARVWLVGTREGTGFRASLAANFDPREWARARQFQLIALIVLNFAWVGLGTVLALWPPVFGVVSIGGAVILVAHFLGLTPIAIMVRERARTPAVAFLRGEWRRAAD